MAGYFNNPDDLKGWVRSKESPDNAAGTLMQMIGLDSNRQKFDSFNDEQDVYDSCRAIFNQEDKSDASEILFGVLAKHNITKLKKEAKIMKKEASEPRARNNWTRNSRNKFNRIVDAYNDNTPWRIGRDKYYDFTHYMIDGISFDEDPNNVYSGEAIWRTYIMDKFYRDYKDEEGKVAGGYIRDRFHVIPDHGTPSNPDFPRHGGNNMELAHGERTRKPRPHQYSIERRLEEDRGNKMESIAVASNSFDKIMKIASSENLEEVRKNRIYNIFKDSIEMREAGIDYETMIDGISDHYNASVIGVAQIDKIAQKMVEKHDGIAYETTIKTAEKMSEVMQFAKDSNITIVDPSGANGVVVDDLGVNSEILLEQGTELAYTSEFSGIPFEDNRFEIVDHPTNSSLIGKWVTFPNKDFEVQLGNPIQDTATELGLNEEDTGSVETLQEETSAYGQEFDITNMD